ncbi:MAG: tyrosine-protein phosphatase [Peptostreptococcaceae bacterium]
MIDIHCHILCGIDDGSKSLAESIEMARIAQNEGIKTIVNTSHYNPRFEFKKGNEILEELDRFNNVLKDNNIDLEVVVGNEVYCTTDIVQIIEEKEFFTINNSRYLLLEFPHMGIPKNISDIIYEIKLRGYTVILAHIERYIDIQKNPNVIYDYINEGALIQVNASSIIGKNGKAAKDVCDMLLDNNMVHVVGTDAHSSTRRRPLMKDTYNHVAQIYGIDRANKIFNDNAKKIINDEELVIEIQEVSNNKVSFLKKIYNKLRGE